MNTNTISDSINAVSNPLELLVGAQSIAKTLGLSARRIYEMSDKNELPGLIKIGSSLAIRKQRLSEWLLGLESAAGTA